MTHTPSFLFNRKTEHLGGGGGNFLAAIILNVFKMCVIRLQTTAYLIMLFLNGIIFNKWLRVCVCVCGAGRTKPGGIIDAFGCVV